jgi:hypothetical protein
MRGPRTVDNKSAIRVVEALKRKRFHRGPRKGQFKPHRIEHTAVKHEKAKTEHHHTPAHHANKEHEVQDDKTKHKTSFRHVKKHKVGEHYTKKQKSGKHQAKKYHAHKTAKLTKSTTILTPPSGQKRAFLPLMTFVVFAVILLLAIFLGLYFTCKLSLKPQTCNMESTSAGSTSAGSISTAALSTAAPNSGLNDITVAGITLAIFIVLGLFGYGAYYWFTSRSVNEETDSLRLEIENSIARKQRSAKGQAVLLGVFREAAENIVISTLTVDEKNAALNKLLSSLEKINQYDDESIKNALKDAGVENAESLFEKFSTAAEVESLILREGSELIKALASKNEELVAAKMKAIKDSSNLKSKDAIKLLENRLEEIKIRFSPGGLDDKIQQEAEKDTKLLENADFVMPRFGTKEANDLVNKVSQGDNFKTMLGGPPSTGKTTLMELWVKAQVQRGQKPLVLYINRSALAKLDKQAGTNAAANEQALKEVIDYAKRQRAVGRPVLIVHDEAQGDINENVFRGNYVKALQNLGDISVLGTTNDRKLFTKKDPDGARSALASRLEYIWAKRPTFSSVDAESFLNRKLQKMKKDWLTGDSDKFKKTVRRVEVLMNNYSPRQAGEWLESAIREAERRGVKSIAELNEYIPNKQTRFQRFTDVLRGY